MSEIVICDGCAGYGKVEKDISEGRDRDWEIVDCDTCKGSGKLLVETKVTTKPFKYNYDKHRHDLRRF